MTAARGCRGIGYLSAVVPDIRVAGVCGRYSILYTPYLAPWYGGLLIEARMEFNAFTAIGGDAGAVA